MALKDTWKETGKGLGFAFRDLGKAVIKTAKTGIDQADKWANGNDNPQQKNDTAADAKTAENTAENNTKGSPAEEKPAE